MAIAGRSIRLLTILSVTIALFWLALLSHLLLSLLDHREHEPNDAPETHNSAGADPKIKHKRDLIHRCRLGNNTVVIPTSAPRFAIIGAQKSGTSSIFRYLLDHPHSRPTRKWLTKKSTETHFFDHHFPKKRKSFTSDEEFYCHVRQVYAKGQFDYDTLLLDATNGTGMLFSFDKTPSYITDAKRLPRMFRKIVPWMERVVVSLRNPIDRAFSHFNMDVEDPRTLPSTDDKEVSLADAFHELVKDEIFMLARAGLLHVNVSAWHYDETTLPDDEMLQYGWEWLPQKAKAAATFLGHSKSSWNDDSDIPLFHLAALNDTQLAAIALLGLQNYVPAYYFEKAKRQRELDKKRELNSEQSMSFSWANLDPAQEATAFERIRKTFIGRGLYAIQLRQWIEEFHPGNIFVANFDEFDRSDQSSRKLFLELLNFLEIPAYEVSDALFRKHNSGNYSVSIHNKTRRILEDLYQPQNKRLATILGVEWRCVWESCT